MADVSVALGTFDGLHVGHMRVLSSALAAKKRVALVFDIPPAMTLSGKTELLISPTEKYRRLEEMGFGVDVMRFESVKDITPEEFLKYVKEKYAPAKICCGFNYRFGKDGRGDTALLSDFCRKNGIELSVTPQVARDGERVSSSRIRELIKCGEPQKAEKLLLKPFSVFGNVSHGDARGRTMGFPTVNFSYPDGLCEAKHGVYAASCVINGREYTAVTYIGRRPTYLLKETVCETNILDFSGNLYEQKLSVSLRRFLREDRLFSSKEELKEQIADDIKEAKSRH